MTRCLVFPVALGGLLLAGSLVLSIACHASQSPVYTVAVVQAGLARQPRAWVGQTVLVRGVAEACEGPGGWGDLPLFESCNDLRPELADPGSAGASEPLPLTWGTQNRLLALLRRWPLVGGLVPPAPTPRWGMLATNRVQLRAATTDLCGGSPCYEALLFDAVP